MNIVDLNVLKGATPLPLLILIDVQREYVESRRPLTLKNHVSAIENCRHLLQHARRSCIPVAFMRWVQPSKIFNPNGAFTTWIDGLEPLGSEMVFDRRWPSAYTSEEFAAMMDEGWGYDAAIAGFTGTIACLATMVDASQRKHRLSFLTDASQSHAIGSHDESAAHTMAGSIISLFGKVESTASWINRTGVETSKTCDRGVTRNV